MLMLTWVNVRNLEFGKVNGVCMAENDRLQKVGMAFDGELLRMLCWKQGCVNENIELKRV